MDDKKKSLVPVLRFSGFVENFQEVKLKYVTKINQGLQISISDRYTEKIENSYFYITNEFLREKSQKKYFIKNPSKSVLCSSEDILMTRTGNTGKVVTGVNGAFHNNFFKIKFDKTKCNKWYLYYFLTSYKTQCNILRLAGTSTIPDLNHGDFYNLKIFLSTLSEQQKIANFLSSVDKKIEQLRQKVSLLEDYKKGVMQQIFSQQIRFKDDNGEAFADWEEKRLNEISLRVKRTTDRVITDILTISAGNGFMNQKERFSQVIAGSSLKKYTLLKKNEFSYNRGNSKSFKYGCIYRLKEYEQALVPNIYRSFKLTQGVPRFFEHLFLFKYLDKQLRRLISSSARMDGLLNIGQDDFYKTKIIIPCNKEQQKIANYLSSLDDKIQQAQNQLKQAQQFKKGLLQQLFV